MAYLGLFTVIFVSCFMGVLGSFELSTSEIEDEGRFLFGTSSAATGTGATAGATTATQITGWETTLIVGVAFGIVFIIWMFLIFGLPSDTAATAHSASVFDPFAGHHATGHHAPTAFASGHHAPTSHHVADSDLHSSYSDYSVLRSLEVAARKYL